MHDRTMNAALGAFVVALLLQLPLAAQTGQKNEDSAKPLETGTFHGKVHSTSGRATYNRSGHDLQDEGRKTISAPL